MTKNRSNTGRSSSGGNSTGSDSKHRSSSSISSRNKNGGSTSADRTQNIAALSNVSPPEAAFLSSLPAEEFNALLEECSDIARGM